MRRLGSNGGVNRSVKAVGYAAAIAAAQDAARRERESSTASGPAADAAHVCPPHPRDTPHPFRTMAKLTNKYRSK
jgi:hypothetical protein